MLSKPFSFAKYLLKKLFEMLPYEVIRQFTGARTNLKKYVRPIRKGFFHHINSDMPGDAPKCFLHLYEYNEGVRKKNYKTWPKHIAKVGHKWYPLESITEHLLNTIGVDLGLNMADSTLVMAGNQLRFLSRYFLEKNERLIHGAEIITSYIGDKAFVDEIENKKEESTFLTFQVVDQSIKNLFPTKYNYLMSEAVKMYIFDAVVGNNDRHFYNWGVITDLKKSSTIKFTPVYDTARGLFWSSPESTIDRWIKDEKNLSEAIVKYSESSRPLTGWDGLSKPSHFDLMEKIFQIDGRFNEEFSTILQSGKLKKIFHTIDDSFCNLISENRRITIKKCLEYRWHRIRKICNFD